MVSDAVIRAVKSTIVLLCILDYIFLPWDALLLGFVRKYDWKSQALYFVMEQFLLLAIRKMDWFTIIFQTLSAVSVQTYLQLYNDPLVGNARAEKLGVSTVLTALVVLDATKNAGMAVLASNISRTVHSRRDLYLKVAGLGLIAIVKALPVFISPEQTPLVATFTSLSRNNFQALSFFLFVRLLTSSPVQSVVVAVTRQWDLRMIFQRTIDRRTFDMDKLIPEAKDDVEMKEANPVRMTGNLNLILFGSYIVIVIIRGML